MAVCKFDGNSDMYGLGIRLGYYLQWYGGIFANWLAPSEVPGIRFANQLFISASFLALIILTVRSRDSLQPVETYIILLLMFGVYLSLVPIFIWRLLTACDPYWDPSRWPLVHPGKLFPTLSLGLLIAVLFYQYWFWIDRVPDLDNYNCQEYAFSFAQIRLNAKGFVVANVVIYFFLGLVCLWIITMKVRRWLEFPELRRQRR